MNSRRGAGRRSGPRGLRVLLRLYPRAFRAEYGAAIHAAQRAGWSEVAHASIRLRARYWLRVLADTLGTATRAHAMRVVTALVEVSGSVRRWRVSGAAVELRRGLRALLRRPGYALAVVLILALGVGSNGAAFGLYSAVLSRPLPYGGADRLVSVWQTRPANAHLRESLSMANYLDVGEGVRAFEGLAGYFARDVNLTGEEAPVRVRGARVSANFFEVMGVEPLLGSTRVEEGVAAVVVSSELWRSRFGADAAVVGRTIWLDERPHQVIAVMPPEFALPRGADVWVPSVIRPGSRSFNILTVVGRLRDGVALEQARAELATVAAALESAFPVENEALELHAEPLSDTLVGRFRSALTLLAGAAAVVLLIACANVANLALVRANQRRREFALRRSLGAGPVRLASPLLAEAAWLAVGGVLAGVLFASLVRPAVLALSPADLPLDGGLSATPTFALALVLVAVVLVFTGCLPAWHVSRQRTNALGEATARGGDSRSLIHTRRALVAAQVGLVVVLLSGAGLFVQTLARLSAQDPGFDRTVSPLTFRTTVPISNLDELSRSADFIAEVGERLRALPGVTHAGAALQLPFVHDDVDLTDVAIEGVPTDPGERRLARLHVVTPGYFEAIGVERIAGRDVAAGDVRGAPAVALVNRAFVERYLVVGGADVALAIGRRIRPELQLLPGSADTLTVVGVVADVRHFGPDQPAEPQVYLAHGQTPWPEMSFVVRGRADPLSLVDEVRREVRAVDARIPIAEVSSLDGILAGAVVHPRLRAVLLAVFALVALLLAAIGVYGVVAQSVLDRQREIGIRMAVGARAAGIARLVLSEELRPVLYGVLAGVPAALGLGALGRGLLYGVAFYEPAILLGVVAVLLLVALLATLYPLRRAIGVEPLEVLRWE